MYIRFISLYPKKIRQYIEQLILYSGMDFDLTVLSNILFVVSFVMSIALSTLLSLHYFKKIHFLFVLILLIISFILFHVVFYSIISMNADKKARKIEEVLPDFLHLFAVNLRSGLPTEKALLFSNRQEFGPLTQEINYIGTQIAFGKTVSEALKNFSTRVKSPQVSRLVDLIIFGMKSGGRLSNLLESLAEDLRGIRITKEKIRGDIDVYIMFIFIAISFGAPLLLGLSSVLIEVMSRIMAEASTAGSVLPLQISTESISPQFVYNYGLIAIVLRAIMGSFVLGLVAKGNEKEGLRYLPFLIAIGLLVYILIRKALSAMLLAYFVF